MRRSPTKSWELGWLEITLYIYNVNRKLSEFTDRQLVPPSAMYWDLQPQWINYDNSGEKGSHQQITLQNIVATIKIQVWSQSNDAKLNQTTYSPQWEYNWKLFLDSPLLWRWNLSISKSEPVMWSSQIFPSLKLAGDQCIRISFL